MKTKALVIDDSKTMRRLLASYLGEYEIESVEAENGREALDRLSENPDANLALVDWDMPEMNGLDFLKEVRSKSEFNDLTIMMVTAQSGIAELQTAMEQGADDYLMKPFDQDMVREKLILLGYAS